MRCSFTNLSTLRLPIFASIILFFAASTFGQEPKRPSGADPYAFVPQQAVKPDTPAHHPPVSPEALLDQLKKVGQLQKPRWESLLRALELAVNLLSGNETNLLSGNKPELLSGNKAALLSGNCPKLLSGNETELLSGNKPKILSDNQTPILSGNRFSLSVLSNLKIEIHIENTGNNSGNHAPPPPPPATEKPLISH
jgi:hypothetical protein